MRYDYHFTHSSHIRFCGWQYCELLVFLCTEYVIHDMQTSFKLSTMIMSESWLYWWTSLCSIQKYSNICKDVVTSDTYSWNCGPQFLVCHCSAHSSLKVGCTKFHQRYLNRHFVNLWQLTLSGDWIVTYLVFVAPTQIDYLKGQSGADWLMVFPCSITSLIYHIIQGTSAPETHSGLEDLTWSLQSTAVKCSEWHALV